MIATCWDAICGSHSNHLDASTVEFLEGLAPGSCAQDRQSITVAFQGNVLFPTVSDMSTRDTLRGAVLSLSCRIPSLHTLLEDSKILELGSTSIRRLLPKKFKGSIQSTLATRRAFGHKVHDPALVGGRPDWPATKEETPLAYINIWLFALRNFPALTGTQPLKDVHKQKPPPRGIDAAVEGQFAKFAQDNGFRSPEITELRGLDRMSDDVDAQDIHGMHTPPMHMPCLKRCGKPTVTMYESVRPYLTVDWIYYAAWEVAGFPSFPFGSSPLFVLREMVRAFFGAWSALIESASAAPPNFQDSSLADGAREHARNPHAHVQAPVPVGIPSTMADLTTAQPHASQNQGTQQHTAPTFQVAQPTGFTDFQSRDGPSAQRAFDEHRGAVIRRDDATAPVGSVDDSVLTDIVQTDALVGDHQIRPPSAHSLLSEQDRACANADVGSGALVPTTVFFQPEYREWLFDETRQLDNAADLVAITSFWVEAQVSCSNALLLWMADSNGSNALAWRLCSGLKPLLDFVNQHSPNPYFYQPDRGKRLRKVSPRDISHNTDGHRTVFISVEELQESEFSIRDLDYETKIRCLNSLTKARTAGARS